MFLSCKTQAFHFRADPSTSMLVCFSVHVMLGRFVDSFSLDKQHVADGGP
jgi:hypothetical protein